MIITRDIAWPMWADPPEHPEPLCTNYDDCPCPECCEERFQLAMEDDYR